MAVGVGDRSSVLLRFLVVSVAALALSGCSSMVLPWSQHVTAEPIKDLGVSVTKRVSKGPAVYASLQSQVPPTFTGCLVEFGECYVLGRYVDARVRFEPQTGRFWFLDPGSGNTYFANGDLRTGNSFRPQSQPMLREGI